MTGFHSDFDIPWCQKILASGIENVEFPTQEYLPGKNSPIFEEILYRPEGIRAQMNFKRPTNKAESIEPWEYCFLLSFGSGIDGKPGRAHGGLSSLLLDQMTGTVSTQISMISAPATVKSSTEFKAPIDTPGVVLCRGWAVKRERRKTWAKALIEDGQGRELATGEALLIDARPDRL